MKKTAERKPVIVQLKKFLVISFSLENVELNRVVILFGTDFKEQKG